MTYRVTLADNTVGAEEIEAVTDVLAGRWLSAGPVTREFERGFAAALGVPDAVAVSSGTAALHLAMLTLDLSAGDEVIMPSLSFVAAAAVTALHGGVPVFADVISAAEPTAAPGDVYDLITPRTQAIVAMHYGGYPARIAELRAVADAAGVPLIEDAAHAPVVRTRDDMLGTVGDIGCFSFHPAKNVTTGEGGLVVARDLDLLARIRAMRSHCVVNRGTHYDVNDIGLNYRPGELGSAIGRVQLAKLPGDRVLRRRLTCHYRSLLSGVGIPFADHTADSAHHLMAIVLPERAPREEVQRLMREAGVQTSVHYPPTHLFSRYRRLGQRRLPVTEGLAGRLLTLPLHSRMDEADVVYVVERLRKALSPWTKG
ncbi:DegT/DnrJ/EryC1/StrS family aminotransferase [Nonomuraea insulae]|uniref:DegT/DnrJ/EryC1/StrS family aminotransferase n=1 Tax=Nonomuraea insulae TaxID=1616787 RepID=A0ABW1D6A8_9ACTN